MTISATYAPDTYAGNGVTTTFAITFPFLGESTYIKVSIKVDATGVITQKTAATHYNVSGSNVVFTLGNYPATGETVIIELDLPYTQESDYTDNSVFPAETLEENLDLLTLEVQLNKDISDRSIKLDSSIDLGSVSTTVEATALTANYIISVNDNADGFELVSPADVALTGSITGSTGIVAETSSGAYAARTITGTASQIAVTNGNGVSGNPTIGLVATTASRALVSDGSGFPTAAAATTTTEIGYVNGVTSAIQTQLNAKQASDATLTALAAYNTNGILTQTAADTFAGRTLTGTANQITVTNGNGVSGNPTLSLPYNLILGSSASGPSSITLNEDTDNGSNTITIQAPSAITANVTLTLPDGDGDANQFLKTDGSGVLSWASGAAGLADVVDDITPQLGGNLDVNGKSIVSVSNGNITLAPNGTGDVVITGSNVVMSSGQGIDFSATTNAAGMTSEVLDDYETGTWTPTLTFSSSQGDRAYVTQVGYYVKVGRVVHVHGNVTLTETTASGTLVLGGLPFASLNAASALGAMMACPTAMTSVTGPIILTNTSTNATTYDLFWYNAGTLTAVSNTNTSTGSGFQFYGSYISN